MGDNDAAYQRTQDIVDDSEDHWRQEVNAD